MRAVPIHAAAVGTAADRTGKGTRCRRDQGDRFRRRYVIEQRVAHETSSKQFVRRRQLEGADDLRELLERDIAPDLQGLARTEVAEEVTVARQEHTVLSVRERHERTVVG